MDDPGAVLELVYGSLYETKGQVRLDVLLEIGRYRFDALAAASDTGRPVEISLAR